MAALGWSTPDKLQDLTRAGKILPLYFLYGDESYLMNLALQELEESVLGDGLRDFNLNIFYGSELDVSKVRDAIETLPIMVPLRVVVIKDAHDVADRKWDELMPILDDPVNSTALICLGAKVDKRKKFIKRFAEKGVVAEFKRPYENQIPDWIHLIGKKNGIKLTSDAVDLMQQLAGSNLQDIHGEMVKLAQFLGERKTATIEDVLSVVSHVRLESIFDLTDAIGRGDRTQALFFLSNLLYNGQSEVGVLALIARHVRILKLVSDGVREGLSGARLSSRAGVSPYFLKSYLQQVRHWNERKIDDTFQALIDTDRALKSSPVASHIWLENFIVHTCS